MHSITANMLNFAHYSARTSAFQLFRDDLTFKVPFVSVLYRVSLYLDHYSAHDWCFPLNHERELVEAHTI